jgi:hypothetical protein
MIVSQFISFGPSVLLPILIYTQGMQLSSILDRFNISLFVTFICLSIVTPFLFIPVNEKVATRNVKKATFK